jgi:hypothetical protein
VRQSLPEISLKVRPAIYIENGRIELLYRRVPIESKETG